MLNVSAAALRFVDDVAAQLPEGNLSSRDRALRDAYAMLVALIWADGRLDGAESEIAKAAARHGVAPSHDGLRRASTLFEELAGLDSADGGRRTALYSTRALDLVNAAMLLDDRIDPSELAAVRHFRALLTGVTASAPITAAQGGQAAGSSSNADSVGLVGQDHLLARLEAVSTSGRAEHAAVVGRVGTGRHSLARLLARAYATSGALLGGQVAEADVADWLAAASGAMAARRGTEAAMTVLQRASGGVLVLDHAELLALEPLRPALMAVADSMTGSGRHAVVLISQSRDHLAPLASLHPNVGALVADPWELNDLGPDQLTEIFDRAAARARFVATPAVLAAVRGRFAAEGPRTGGAQRARRLLDMAVARHTSRTLERSVADTAALDVSDLPAAEPVGP